MTRHKKGFTQSAPESVEPRPPRCARSSPQVRMRPNLTSSVLFAWLLPLCTTALLAQEPDATKPQEPAPPAAEQPVAPADVVPAATEPAAIPAARRGGRRPVRTVAVLASHVHPVAASDIEEGVVLVRGDRIVAVGKQGEVEIPEGAETVRFDGAHIYPGLVDASSDAFLDDAARNDSSADAATPIADWWTAGKAPVLIIQGLADVAAPPANGRMLVEELGARGKLVELEGVGHSIPVEAPEETAAALLPFLKEQARA